MADRYPLILDTTDGNRIKELPNGDNLKLAGSSIVDVENIVATGTIQVDTLVVTTLQASGSNLSLVATTGDFNDLINVPNIFDGDFNNLTNKPTLFSGDFNDLSNKPVIASNTSQLINDTGFITNNTAALSVNNLIDIAEVARTNSYDDLDDKPNLNEYLRADAVVDGTLTVDVNNTGNLEGNVVGIDGTTLLVDADNNAIIGTLIRGSDSGVNIDGNGEDVNISTSSVISLTAESILLNGEVSATLKGSIDGDVRGSVFGDDSTVLVDGINKVVNARLNGDLIKTAQTLTISNTGSILIQSGGGLDLNLNSSKNMEIVTADFDVSATGAISIESTATLSLIVSNGKLYIESGNAGSSDGGFGDRAGMLSFDSQGIMYCVEDYTNGTNNIWKRIPWLENYRWSSTNDETDGITISLPNRTAEDTDNQIRISVDQPDTAELPDIRSAITLVGPVVDIGFDSLNSNANLTKTINIGEGARNFFNFTTGQTEQFPATQTYLKGRIIFTTTVPSTARGASGDKLGQVAFDGNYLYYCIANYTNGSSPIWVRTAWGDTSDWS